MGCTNLIDGAAPSKLFAWVGPAGSIAHLSVEWILPPRSIALSRSVGWVAPCTSVEWVAPSRSVEWVGSSRSVEWVAASW